MTRVLVLALVSATALGISSRVIAQEAPDTDASLDEEARALFEAGRAAFGAGRIEDALGHFQAAFDRSQRPELLYNVGLAADRLRRDQIALDAYEKFLDSVPNTEFRGMVEERIAFLRTALSASRNVPLVEPPDDPPTYEPPTYQPPTYEPPTEPTPPPPQTPPAPRVQPPPEPEPQPEPPRSLLVPGIVVAAGGAAVLAAGVGLAVSGFNTADDVEDTLSQVWTEALQDDYDAASRRAVSGIVLLGVGVLAAGAGVLMIVLGPSSSDAVAVDVGPGSVHVRGRF